MIHPTRLLIVALLASASACASGPSPEPAAPTPGGAATMDARAPIAVSLDLAALDADRVRVTVDPGPLTLDTVLFRLPRVVQGTYAVGDYGRFVEGLTAWATDGTRMAVTQTDPNTWTVADAARFDRFEYLVNDTYDVERTDTPTPFSPAGTNIDPDAFVLNLHGFVGYVEGMEDEPYEIAVRAPLGMARSSALRTVAADTSRTDGVVTDVYRAERYFEVTDNPMMYGDLTTETFTVGDIEIVLSVYSPGGAHTAAQLRDVVYDMMAAQRTYLGDLDTTDRYDVYLYLAGQGADAPTGFGALEHHTSTVVVLPEVLPAEQIADAMVDVVSHEFFHIVTPLGVHSEDIHYFDYHTPTFSKHLWMYEGVTEYFASHFQVYEGLESREDFYGKLAEKIEAARAFDDTLSFTVMSENILEEPYASNYVNVYQKGALFGVALDIILREQSGGARSLLSVMEQLSARYGKDRPFNDDALIDELTDMTYPEVGAFLRTHVAGTTPIDYDATFAKVGLELVEVEVPTTLFFLDPQVPFIDADPTDGHLFFRDIRLNTSLEAMGVRPGDVIRSINGTAYTLQNAGQILGPSFQWGPDTEVRMVLERDGVEVEVSGVVGSPTVTQPRVREVAGATAAQRALRDAWLGSATASGN